MHILYDPDEYEIVSDSRPCTVCNGDLSKCNGMCNGMSSLGHRRRTPEEIARIKAARKRQEEDEILAKAEAIKAIRAAAQSA